MILTLKSVSRWQFPSTNPTNKPPEGLRFSSSGWSEVHSAHIQTVWFSWWRSCDINFSSSHFSSLASCRSLGFSQSNKLIIINWKVKAKKNRIGVKRINFIIMLQNFVHKSAAIGKIRQFTSWEKVCGNSLGNFLILMASQILFSQCRYDNKREDLLNA